MPGKRLRQLGMNAAIGQVRDERVSKGVEVHDSVLCISVQDPSGGQIDTQNPGELLATWHAEQWLIKFSFHEVFIKRSRGCWTDRKRIVPPMF